MIYATGPHSQTLLKKKHLLKTYLCDVMKSPALTDVFFMGISSEVRT